MSLQIQFIQSYVMTYKISVIRHLLKKLNLLFLKSSHKETLEPDGLNSEFFQLFKKEITSILHKSSDIQKKKIEGNLS